MNTKILNEEELKQLSATGEAAREELISKDRIPDGNVSVEDTKELSEAGAEVKEVDKATGRIMEIEASENIGRTFDGVESLLDDNLFEEKLCVNPQILAHIKATYDLSDEEVDHIKTKVLETHSKLVASGDATIEADITVVHNLQKVDINCINEVLTEPINNKIFVKLKEQSKVGATLNDMYIATMFIEALNTFKIMKQDAEPVDLKNSVLSVLNVLIPRELTDEVKAKVEGEFAKFLEMDFTVVNDKKSVTALVTNVKSFFARYQIGKAEILEFCDFITVRKLLPFPHYSLVVRTELVNSLLVNTGYHIPDVINIQKTIHNTMKKFNKGIEETYQEAADKQLDAFRKIAETTTDPKKKERILSLLAGVEDSTKLQCIIDFYRAQPKRRSDNTNISYNAGINRVYKKLDADKHTYESPKLLLDELMVKLPEGYRKARVVKKFLVILFKYINNIELVNGVLPIREVFFITHVFRNIVTGTESKASKDTLSAIVNVIDIFKLK